MSENTVQKSEKNLVTPAVIGAGELGSNGLLKKRRKVSLDSKKARAGYMFVLPFILGVILLYLPILLDSIWFNTTAMKSENIITAGTSKTSCCTPATSVVVNSWSFVNASL